MKLDKLPKKIVWKRTIDEHPKHFQDVLVFNGYTIKSNWWSETRDYWGFSPDLTKDEKEFVKDTEYWTELENLNLPFPLGKFPKKEE